MNEQRNNKINPCQVLNN